MALWRHLVEGGLQFRSTIDRTKVQNQSRVFLCGKGRVGNTRCDEAAQVMFTTSIPRLLAVGQSHHHVLHDSSRVVFRVRASGFVEVFNIIIGKVAGHWRCTARNHPDDVCLTSKGSSSIYIYIYPCVTYDKGITLEIVRSSYMPASFWRRRSRRQRRWSPRRQSPMSS